MTDTTITADTTLPELYIASGDRYILAPDRNIVLTIAVDYSHVTPPANNIVVDGTIRAHPDATHDHTIRFTGIDESHIVGAPNGLGVGTNVGPPASDAGIWIMPSGQFDLIGKTKAGWNRTGSDPTWQAGDEVYAVPWGMGSTTPGKVDYGQLPDSYKLVTPNAYTPLFYDLYQDPELRQYQEVFNVTRNLHIKGTSATQRTHVMNMSTIPHDTKYVEFVWCGIPVIASGGKNQTFSRIGRYVYHNHLRRAGSRGSHFTGLIARGSGPTNIFVSHGSDGLIWDDCIAWGFDNAYWYDLASDPNLTNVDTPNFNAPDDLLYNRCAAFGLGGGKGFVHDATVRDNHNECRDCVVAGTNVGGESAAGYSWSNNLNGVPNIDWNWHDNIIHNYQGKGIFSWQNGGEQHTVYRAKSFYCWVGNQPNDGKGRSGGDVDSGAYNNSYDFVDCLFTDVVADETTAHGNETTQSTLFVNGVKAMPGKNWIRCHFNRFIKESSPLNTSAPTRLIDCLFEDTAQIIDEIGGGDKTDGHTELDFIRCNIDVTAPNSDPTNLVWGGGRPRANGPLNPLTKFRVQNVDGSAWQMDAPSGIVLEFAEHVTTAALPSCTYTNGTAGVGAKLTATANGALSFGDSKTTKLAERCVIKNQVAPEQNGVYSITALGSAGAPWVLTRVADYDESNEIVRASIFVGGAIGGGGGTTWLMTTTGTVVVGTTPITWSSVSIIPRTWHSIQPFALYIQTNSLAVAASGDPYSQQLAAVIGEGLFGTSIISWAVAPDSPDPLPTGLVLDSTPLPSGQGLLHGTPSQLGTFQVKFRAEDQNYFTADRTLQLVVGVSASLQITTSSLPNGVVDTPYPSTQLVATGGVAPRTFSIVSGALPAGLSLSSSGLITGTPTTAESRSPTFRVTDSVSATAQRQLQIDVVNLNPIITTATISDGEVALGYTGSLAASGGTPPYTFDVMVGPLPPGVTFSSLGQFGGTPTTPGTYPIRMRVTDSASHTGIRDYSLLVYPALDLPQPSFPAGVMFQPYQESVAVSGGAPPLFFEVPTIDPGALPPGLAMDSQGVVSGFPTQAGTFDFLVHVIDSLAVERSRQSQMVIAVPATVPEVKRSTLRAFGQRLPTGGSHQRDRVP